jgi:hypothetical protein
VDTQVAALVDETVRNLVELVLLQRALVSLRRLAVDRALYHATAVADFEGKDRRLHALLTDETSERVQ